MPERVPFVHRLLKSLDRVDRRSIEKYVLDITEKIEAYREVFDELNEGVVLLNEQGQIQLANKAAVLWLGLFEGGKSRFWDSLSDPEFARFAEEHLPGLKTRTVKDLQLLSPREMFVRVFLIPMDRDHEEMKTLIVLVNMNEVKSLEFDQERISRIESLISLAAGIAHEIGNPLNSISIHLQLLKKELKELPEPKRRSMAKTLSVIHLETERLDRILKNFLKATRKSPLRFKNDNLNELVEESLAFMAPELKASGIRVDFRPDREMGSFLFDRERLYQVFINLIKNAKEAMPDGGRLKISLSHRNNLAVLVFQDNGVGIHEKDIPHIFEAYYTTKDEGSGLGLLTVYNAIREHSGKIEVESRAGKGTTFTIFLPMRRPRLQLSEEKIPNR